VVASLQIHVTNSTKSNPSFGFWPVQVIVKTHPHFPQTLILLLCQFLGMLHQLSLKRLRSSLYKSAPGTPLTPSLPHSVTPSPPAACPAAR
jgi:hypothetical protein